LTVDRDVLRTDRKASTLALALVGAGVMAAVDELVFHQILGWHHFYDRSTPRVGLMSDGFLHAAELLALVGGFYWFAELRRRGVAHGPSARAGFFLGAGGFQLFDGLVDHKLLRVHQIRYGVELITYDVIWIAAAVVLLLVGVLLRRKARHLGDGPAGTR
jgi:uncharacterized membrane protein